MLATRSGSVGSALSVEAAAIAHGCAIEADRKLTLKGTQSVRRPAGRARRLSRARMLGLVSVRDVDRGMVNSAHRLRCPSMRVLVARPRDRSR